MFENLTSLHREVGCNAFIMTN